MLGVKVKMRMRLKGFDMVSPFKLNMMLLIVCSFMQVKSVLQKCNDNNPTSGDYVMSVDDESDNDYLSNTKVKMKKSYNKD